MKLSDLFFYFLGMIAYVAAAFVLGGANEHTITQGMIFGAFCGVCWAVRDAGLHKLSDGQKKGRGWL